MLPSCAKLCQGTDVQLLKLFGRLILGEMLVGYLVLAIWHCRNDNGGSEGWRVEPGSGTGSRSQNVGLSVDSGYTQPPELP